MRPIGVRTRRQLLAQTRVRAPRWPMPSSARVAREVVLSLTTYPARVDGAWQAIRSLLRQSAPADRVVLVLYEGDFPQQNVPPRLATLESEGVEILWSAVNARSHLKLLPVLEAFPDAIVVTADDDTLYPWRWLAGLREGHKRDPCAVLAYRAHEMQLGAATALRPYNSWPRATPDSPWSRVFPTGVGGVLYPPGALAQEAFDLELALRLCPTADDVWFKAMTLLNDTRSAVLPGRPEDLVVVLRSQATQLMQLNVRCGANDEQLERTLSHFELWPLLGGDGCP